MNLEWISFGLDLYAENLMESYLYKFDSLRSLISYLESNYNINETQIPKSYKIDNDQFPNPIKNSDKEVDFKVSWNKFQEDFKNGLFLDKTLSLVHASTKQT